MKNQIEQIILFQFHKVRLEVDQYTTCYGMQVFQFHKVRLEVGQTWRNMRTLWGFNSIRYD